MARFPLLLTSAISIFALLGLHIAFAGERPAPTAARAPDDPIPQASPGRELPSNEHAGRLVLLLQGGRVRVVSGHGREAVFNNESEPLGADALLITCEAFELSHDDQDLSVSCSGKVSLKGAQIRATAERADITGPHISLDGGAHEPVRMHGVRSGDQHAFELVAEKVRFDLASERFQVDGAASIDVAARR